MWPISGYLPISQIPDTAIDVLQSKRQHHQDLINEGINTLFAWMLHNTICASVIDNVTHHQPIKRIILSSASSFIFNQSMKCHQCHSHAVARSTNAQLEMQSRERSLLLYCSANRRKVTWELKAPTKQIKLFHQRELSLRLTVRLVKHHYRPTLHYPVCSLVVYVAMVKLVNHAWLDD